MDLTEQEKRLLDEMNKFLRKVQEQAESGEAVVLAMEIENELYRLEQMLEQKNNPAQGGV